MFLVVGLGNPGPKYQKNRHNVGFMVVERLASRAGASGWKDKWRGRHVKASLGAHDVVLVEPLTYMNLAGECVQPTAAFFRVEPKAIICVHDELDLDFDVVRIKVAGGTAGHNGLKSMVQHIGPDFIRVRMGIGRPPKGATESWVLGDFGPDERPWLDAFVDRAADAVEAIIREGVGPATNRVNTREPKAPKA